MNDWIHIIISSVLFVVTLFAITKMGGKKQLSELSFFEYVSGITIGSIAGEVIMGLDGNLFHGVLAIVIFGTFTYLHDLLGIKSKKFRDLVEGKSTVIIKDGKVLEENLKKEKYTLDELNSLLRQKNVFKTADVEFAVLEPKGDLSVLLKKELQPLSPKDLNLSVAPEKESYTVIMDGNVLNDQLASAGKSKGWLDIELANLGVTLDNVFLAQVDSFGKLSIDTYDDQIQVPSPQPRKLLLAMLNKCQADLELFALGTESSSTKAMYNKNAKKLQEAIHRLKPFLKE
ncbi:MULTISPECIES: DUF421 domain-containing protein [unclassified Bacillus (in: firmicutes)]|uniref:DUF421 domain-containing protein n=1 Tax=unclassified Bacillus (in: firmicutes) TaxID=185979 RepID=UPI001BEC0C5A|nr:MULTISPECIES: DUF421 domain-containing protein [unclassified Bacillus (in: firmicutes)]MBT2637965.1 DUF421 domain-containing protein [Bacillus sp. ISL-39]MBT2661141.1 DUF421 domain-containing protein [Bacillus sp. ISL-45]